MDGLDDFSLRKRPPKNDSDRHAEFYVPVKSNRVANEATHLQFRQSCLIEIPASKTQTLLIFVPLATSPG